MTIDISALAAEADELARDWLDGDPVAARPRLDALRADFRAALQATTSGEHAAALAEVLALDAEGQPAAAIESVLAAALAIAGAVSPSAAVAAGAVSPSAAVAAGAVSPSAAVAAGAVSPSAAVAAGADPRPRARILIVRARSRYLLGHYSDATADAAEAFAVLKPYPTDDPLVLRALLYASVTDRDTGQLARARRRAAEVGRMARAAGDHHLAAWADLHEASAALMLGHVGEARMLYDDTLDAAKALGMKRVEALAITNLGHCAFDAGELERAERYFREASALFEAIGDRLLANKLEVRIARIVLERGDPTRAASLASAADTEAKRVDDRDTAVRASFVIGRARLAEALALAQENGFVSMLAQLDSDRAADSVPATAAPPLRIAPDATWFEPPGGRRVDLRTRVPLRRLLQHLVERRLASSATTATTDDLVGAGWPSERILVDAARDRVYSAVGMLRRLGLERFIVRLDGGYALDPEVRVVIG